MLDISNAELDVMQVIWQQAPCTAADVISRLQQHKDWHEKTVKTLLNRLVSKGALSYQKQGRAYLYSPCIAQQDYQQQASGNFIDRLFAGRVAPLVASFARKHDVSAADLAELKQLVADLEQEQQEDN
ncbi:BlaI/MecI/CopY family transcriptional regulator [Alkalimonas collagenimarina]|uniref:BlaI/MecI/CopY family transcriptional regulator n=1 Tax=Alkalimonas collagenimarina TaxID=400390 RepID=A0ABT9H1J7_9GAMM|nr:BlaI/MecI/CopY family transcriptional regulator [Alkalimonas collagenimarina]MDP4537163.1 BlaI/MecI/CopY family transcriptional regulator [Alkalimonas collagenimarina]